MASLEQRLKKQREELSKKGGEGQFFFLKEGTVRMRPLPVGKDNDFAVEAVYFYLGGEIKGVISPATFGEPCAIMEAYQKLKASKSDEDKTLAKSISPKKRYFVPHIKYMDDKGKELDKQAGPRLLGLTGSQYQDLIDLYLDSDEAGDFTDAKNGYDIKYTRTGTGQFDTEYTVRACKPTSLPKEYLKQTFDPADMVKKSMPTYEETMEIVKKVFGSSKTSKKKKGEDLGGKLKKKKK